MSKRHKEEKERGDAEAKLRAFGETLVDSAGVVSEENQGRVLDYGKEHGFTSVNEDGDRVLSLPDDIGHTFMLGAANRGSFIECDTTLLLERGELAYCESSAGLLAEVTSREFRGGSRGVSVPLGHASAPVEAAFEATWSLSAPPGRPPTPGASRSPTSGLSSTRAQDA